MTCLRHDSCRRAAFNTVLDWPTATYPRAFVAVCLGTFGTALLVAAEAALLGAWLYALSQGWSL